MRDESNINRNNNLNLDKILEELFSLHRFGIKPGLERTFKILGLTGEPQKNFKSIHVAGTNGKGSVSSCLASIFSEAGYKTGLYTSPHLVKFNERIRINGIVISDHDLVRLSQFYLPFSKELGCTFFEITTAIAFNWFSENNVDIAIIETGLGGRFDSTNVITPELSVITRIDMDHSEYLGNTIREIAAEKAGIIKKNVPVITFMQEDINDIFVDKVKANNSKLIFADEIFKIIKYNLDEEFNLNLSVRTKKNTYNDVIINLAGRHQIENVELAIASILTLRDRYFLTEEHIRRGLKNIKINTGLMGRIDLLRKQPPLILDVAHNPGGIKALVDTILESPYSNQKFNVIFAAMNDKNVGKMLKLLAPIQSKMSLTVPSIERAANLQELEKQTKEAGISDYMLFDCPIVALGTALNNDEPIIITGSFYLAGELLPELNRILI